jgi:hypothetical protein
MSFAATDPTYCRVTVLAPRSRVNVALPADLPVAELVPMVLELVGEPVFGLRPQPWRLFRTAGEPLPSGGSLRGLGVLDGELLRIAPDGPAPPAPVFDDPVDALAATTGTGADSGRFHPVVVLSLGAAAALLLGVPIPAELFGERQPADPVAFQLVPALIAAPAAVAAVAWAARAVRRPIPAPGPGDHAGRTAEAAAERAPASEPHSTDVDRPGGPRRPAPVHNLPAATCAALVAVTVAAAAGWAALPGATAPARLLVAAAAAGGTAALAQLAVRALVPALVGVIVTAVPVGAAAWIVLRLGVPPSTAAVAVGALALVVGPFLPRAALWLSGMPRPVVPADADELVDADEGPDLLPAAELLERAELARGYLAGLVGGAAVLAAAAALPAAALPGWAGPVFAAVTTALLGLRARSFVDPGPAGAAAAGALASGVGLAVVLAWSSGPWAGPVAAAALLLVAAAFLRAAFPRPVGSPVRRRAVDLTEGALTAAVVPLALAALDLYRVLRGL